MISRPQPASHAAERALAPPSFADREEAARQLAERLLAYRGKNPLVLAIPRGAVPMARVIAQQLGGELDVVLVRKLRAPLQPELAIGAVNESGWLYLGGQGYRHGVSDSYLATERRDQMQTIRERRARYAKVRPAVATAGRVVIVVDDGLATGATMIAALHGLRQSKPAKLVCAVPVAPADTLARLDVAAGLAEGAAQGGWCRPHMTELPVFTVEAGRHPVVERAIAQDGARFVANDVALGDPSRLWLVTGPNMGGKSTFLRQNALIAVLAQAGSFVPAQAARLGLVDRLFSRVGASDNLAKGRSTFMVEMVETAAILSQATAQSLVILDEVGRGTSTYDGLAIAWAVVEAVHEVNRSRCLFATHYHELTRLAETLDSLSLHHVRAREHKGDLVLLHELADGPADRSYGLAVARLAGLPAPVIGRAKAVLAKLEAGRAATGGLAAGLDDLPLFAALIEAEPAERDPVTLLLEETHPDQLSPREALDLIYRLKVLAG